MIDLRLLLVITIFANVFYSFPYSVYQILTLGITLSAGINLFNYFGRFEAEKRAELRKIEILRSELRAG